MLREKETYLAYPKNTAKVLQQYGFRFKKQLGQNFLIDLFVLEKILRSCGASPGDVVLEIGPGIGSLTEGLLEKTGEKGRVIAVEIDETLIPVLRDNLSAYPQLHLIQGDFLKLDLSEIAALVPSGKKLIVAANLPYYVTTPILMRLLESDLPIRSMTVMVQEEVARRMKAGPGNKDYGALSLAVQYYGQPEIAAHVPPHCFMPRPNVGSAVLTLSLYEMPPVQPQDKRLMFSLIRAAFQQRRKTLVNSLTGSAELHFTKETLLEGLEEARISGSVRGETLTLSDFARLSDALSGKERLEAKAE